MKRNVLFTVTILALLAVIGLSTDRASAYTEFSCEPEVFACFAIASDNSSYTFNWTSYNIGGSVVKSEVITKSIGVDRYDYCDLYETTRRVTVTVTGDNGQTLLTGSRYVNCDDGDPL